MPATPSINPDATVLTGVLERIIFHNEENAYTIAEFRPEEERGTVTITGSLPGVQCGETLRLTGSWVRHSQHGLQFRATGFKSELPSTVHGIRKYLGSGLVPGIGKVYAERIVDHFGADTLRIISEESARLRDVDGIGPQRAASIKAAWDAQRSVREIMVFLQTYGVTTSQCVRIHKRFGSQAPEILRTQPYRIAREIDGIGFKTADRIALNVGFANDSPARLDAGSLYALQELEDEGHTAAPETEFADRAATLLETTPARIRERIEALVASRDLIRNPSPAPGGPALLQLPSTSRAEARIAAALHRLLRVRSALPPIKVDAAIAWAQERAGFTFGGHQAEALRQALRHKFTILTGGPGTGKTSILRALVAILKAKKARVHLAAPTGRAAQRLSETTGGFAQTIHRLLKFDMHAGGFTVNEDNPLSTDFLIVDEASMLDSRLAAALLSAVPSAAHVLLVGDVDQLPSVGSGNVLQDLIACGLAPVTRLTHIYRQKDGSLIVGTAHAINGGDPSLPPVADSAGAVAPFRDLQFVAVHSPEACVDAVLELCTRILPKQMPGLDPLQDVQVLAPMHKGAAGVSNLNQCLQEALNPPERSGGNAILGFRRGDKVIQLRNKYDKGVFNGDIGTVLSLDGVAGALTVDFDGERVTLDRGDLSDLALAYAISIHKSQGSEYPVVVMLLLKAHFMMLQRNLLYTGLTRGRRRVVVVGEPAAWAMAVRNAESRARCTHLREKIAAG